MAVCLIKCCLLIVFDYVLRITAIFYWMMIPSWISTARAHTKCGFSVLVGGIYL